MQPFFDSSTHSHTTTAGETFATACSARLPRRSRLCPRNTRTRSPRNCQCSTQRHSSPSSVQLTFHLAATHTHTQTLQRDKPEADFSEGGTHWRGEIGSSPHLHSPRTELNSTTRSCDQQVALAWQLHDLHFTEGGTACLHRQQVPSTRMSSSSGVPKPSKITAPTNRRITNSPLRHHNAFQFSVMCIYYSPRPPFSFPVIVETKTTASFAKISSTSSYGLVNATRRMDELKGAPALSTTTIGNSIAISRRQHQGTGRASLMTPSLRCRLFYIQTLQAIDRSFIEQWTLA
uniref:Uncharacterized protein n=1 Tax=Echinococcus granulosus TaxID=6210 RepID=A0A068WVD0_ECHGR|nr:hypothetical protein EgrG_000363600 [Echinococcus granulosus]